MKNGQVKFFLKFSKRCKIIIYEQLMNSYQDMFLSDVKMLKAPSIKDCRKNILQVKHIFNKNNLYKFKTNQRSPKILSINETSRVIFFFYQDKIQKVKTIIYNVGPLRKVNQLQLRRLKQLGLVAISLSPVFMM